MIIKDAEIVRRTTLNGEQIWAVLIPEDIEDGKIMKFVYIASDKEACQDWLREQPKE